VIDALEEFDKAARHALHYYGGRSHRYALLIASTAGLIAGLADLHDLIEHAKKPTYPILQLGTPVIAFGIAVASSYVALVVAGRHMRTVVQRFARLEGDLPASTRTQETIRFSLRVERLFACEMSLRRAPLALFVIGTIAFAVAEYEEHGLWWAFQTSVQGEFTPTASEQAAAHCLYRRPQPQRRAEPVFEPRRTRHSARIVNLVIRKGARPEKERPLQRSFCAQSAKCTRNLLKLSAAQGSDGFGRG